LLTGHQKEPLSKTLMKKFEDLDENDQNEILNLIEFKRMMKARRSRE